MLLLLLLLLLPGVFGCPPQAGRQAASGGQRTTGETLSCSLAAAAYILQNLTAIRRNCWSKLSACLHNGMQSGTGSSGHSTMLHSYSCDAAAKPDISCPATNCEVL
jgi:hypothetical protein